MDPLAAPDDPLQRELSRLNAELEQALVAAEDSQKEVTALAHERDALEAACAVHQVARERAEASRRSTEDSGIELRRELAGALELIARLQLDEREGSARDEELGVALEEAQTLAEELQVANGTLDQANSSLELMNADLLRRIKEEAAARQEAQSRLLMAQKLEAVGQLTGGIAHDFNNLLTVITGTIQFLRQPHDDARRQRLLRRIEEAAWRGADLTRRLLAFGRRQPLKPDRVDFRERAIGLTELLRHTLRADIDVNTRMDPNLWPIEVDGGALELALLNLAVNARDAMPKSGAIELVARNVPMQSDQLTRFELNEGDYVDISMTDTGSGIPPELLDRVFEPFFTTKDVGKGTGLGLAQVYGFARQSGGTAWVDSELGVGTCVHIVLPRSWREAMSDMAANGSAGGRASERTAEASVLVVEDDEAVAGITTEMLGELGHRPVHVDSVAAALDVLSGEQKVDLVFTDVLLRGGGSGLDLAHEIARRDWRVPVVLTSGYDGGEPSRLAAANLLFLRKPYRIEALKMVIEEALQQQPARAGD